MLNYFKAFSIFLFWVLIALSSHYYISNKYFNNCNLSLGTIKIATTTKNLLYLDTGEECTSIYNLHTGFIINKQNSHVSSILNMPFLKDSIRSILDYDYSKELHIIGKYTVNEINAMRIGNIGLQRAEFVKRELISLGILPFKIKTLGNIFNFSYSNKGIYDHGIEMKLKNIQQPSLDSLEYRIANKTLYVNFENGNLLDTKYLAGYTLILKQYLKKYVDKKVQIIGHTDNLGYYDKNLIIGMNSAIKVREYFVNNGINFNKIITLSKGESEPIAKKGTEEGRAKNRRIELKIN
ncbi:OmpA family protein [bacterium AH-315-A23]|nr:OmpA family protein [bacterium AH-315-A23]PHS52985.1 MAG: hypothetical protein COB01_05370 [Lutibacter sp.]